jgi:hypothetical protein
VNEKNVKVRKSILYLVQVPEPSFITVPVTVPQRCSLVWSIFVRVLILLKLLSESSSTNISKNVLFKGSFLTLFFIFRHHPAAYPGGRGVPCGNTSHQEHRANEHILYE